MRFPVPFDDAEQDILLRAEALLTSRYNRVCENTVMTDPSSAGKLLQVRLATHEREVFCAAYLDSRHRIIAVEDLHAGTIDGCEVHSRVLVQRALFHNAAAVLIAHNHPSGSLDPSAADRAMTSRMKAALALVDIRLLDSFVVAVSGFVSLAARGWI